MKIDKKCLKSQKQKNKKIKNKMTKINQRIRVGIMRPSRGPQKKINEWT